MSDFEKNKKEMTLSPLSKRKLEALKPFPIKITQEPPKIPAPLAPIPIKPKKNPNMGPRKCFKCRKKHMVIVTCRCGHKFCTAHLNGETHNCSFKYTKPKVGEKIDSNKLMKI